MNADNKYIRFDWAVKRMLRDKANFGVLEGLLTVLLKESVHIVELLESEGNQQTVDDKFNRVDIKAKNDLGELFIVEVQLTRELYYLERILYGTAKTITEHIKLGNSYSEIKKVYSVSIVYFDLGQGSDYLYHGYRDGLSYYVVMLNRFNKVARTPLEEWVDYLKNGHIKDDTTVPGLSEAKEKLQYLMLNQADRHAYDEHLNAIMIQNDVLSTARLEGLAEGRAKDREEGRKEGREEERKKNAEERRESARSMKEDGMSATLIAKYTGLSEKEISGL